MDRVNFIESLSGIEYPEMIVSFFDHIIALKQLVENNGAISVVKCTDNIISFNIHFDSIQNKDNALATIYSVGDTINIYGRHIHINPVILNDTSISIDLV